MNDKATDTTKEEQSRDWTDAEWTPEADQLQRIGDAVENISSLMGELVALLTGAAEAAGEYIAKKSGE